MFFHKDCLVYVCQNSVVDIFYRRVKSVGTDKATGNIPVSDIALFLKSPFHISSSLLKLFS